MFRSDDLDDYSLLPRLATGGEASSGRLRAYESGRAYASVHLMEDLDTNALPAADNARDGVLDV